MCSVVEQKGTHDALWYACRRSCHASIEKLQDLDLLLLNQPDGPHRHVHLSLNCAKVTRKLVHLVLHGRELLHQLGDGLQQHLLHVRHLIHQEAGLWSEFIGPHCSLLQADPTRVTNLRQSHDGHHLPLQNFMNQAERIMREKQRV
jgi:hypothetical protein